MEYKAYKLQFPYGVHFGNKSLDSTDNVFYADTLFSALCHEALKENHEKLEELVGLVKNGQLILSDAFPYIEDTLYIPKPMLKVNRQNESNSIQKKAYKKLSYIPQNQLYKYLDGEVDAISEVAKLQKLGFTEIRAVVSVRGEEEAKPFHTAVYHFNDKCGLYIICAYNEDKDIAVFEDLLLNLSYSGIGGNRTSGLGRFELFNLNLDDGFKKCLECSNGKQLLLSVSLPEQSEMDAVQEATYNLVKRSGFVASAKYANEYLRKKDVYAFSAGSCFEKRYKGVVADVSNGGNHEVYRCLMPLFMGVDR